MEYIRVSSEFHNYLVLIKNKIMSQKVNAKVSCPFTEEMPTKCGHIFWKGCIKMAISRQNKCPTQGPTCRKKVTAKELIRVFLPSII
ncbi:hypothetical protein Bca52824_051870 [Brassica carinata]|uniref:Zinc finger C3HC4 RING-type domain-containing protein n=1 Tax=Brassica carinata TaxID=52824 RepID=A0A8X7UI62_BRACI|nr:hypothetical protein Bca52824_051870 [Brassica carinata]